jgi:hypothetical protein
MTKEEYIDLFHKAQVNLVAFKQVFHCDEELRRMVETAVEAEREACAKVCDKYAGPFNAHRIGECADAIRARGIV